MGRLLDINKGPNITIDALVAERIVQIQQAAAVMHVERDIFLCGEVYKQEATITSYIDPLEYRKGIAISVLPDKYDERIAERVTKLIETLEVINIPQRSGILGILQRLYRANKLHDAQRQIKDIPEASYFSLNAEQKPLTPEQVLSHPASVIYSPQQIKYNLLFVPKNSHFVSENLLSQRLRERDVIGHYHVHTIHHPELAQFFSRQDIRFGVALKEMFEKRKILLGVGYLGRKDHYFSI